jgi:hypothetical protein
MLEFGAERSQESPCDDLWLSPGKTMTSSSPGSTDDSKHIVSATKKKLIYHELIILATSPATDIWLGDDMGHFVQKETGEMNTSLLPGHYTVEFGLGAPTYPIHLTKASRYTQSELEAGPTCPRPKVQLLDD